MRQQHIQVSRTLTTAAVRAVLQAAAAEVDGQITLEGNLKTYPGSLHWNVKHPVRSGTLEATYWPKLSELWVTLHDNRRGNWATEAFLAFAQLLEQGLSHEVGSE